MHQSVPSLYSICKSYRVQNLFGRLGEHNVKVVNKRCVLIVNECLE